MDVLPFTLLELALHIKKSLHLWACLVVYNLSIKVHLLVTALIPFSVCNIFLVFMSSLSLCWENVTTIMGKVSWVKRLMWLGVEAAVGTAGDLDPKGALQ